MAGAGSDDRLQQYFDGDLPPEEADALRALLDEDAAAKAKLEGLAHLRTMLVAAAEERAEEIDSEALFSAIEARLDANGSADGESDAGHVDAGQDEEGAKPARPAFGVLQGGKVQGGKAQGGKATTSAEPKPAPKSNVVWIGIGLSLAVAAAVLLIVRPFSDGGDELAVAPPHGSEVVEVDFGYSTGAIFSVEGQEGEHYAVIWISDEKPAVDTPPVQDESSQERVQ